MQSYNGKICLKVQLLLPTVQFEAAFTQLMQRSVQLLGFTVQLT